MVENQRLINDLSQRETQEKPKCAKIQQRLITTRTKKQKKITVKRTVTNLGDLEFVNASKNTDSFHLRNNTCFLCLHSLVKTEANVWEISRAD